jgi:hypothetical protein
MAESDPAFPGASAPRSTAKRAAKSAARPLVSYFDRRFQDLHDHLDRQRIPSDLESRLDQMVALSRQTRKEVADDADTITEIAFTLERFADLFTARMEEIVETMVSTGPGPAPVDEHIVELPFAFATADALPTGSHVATLSADGGPLPIALASVGLRVTALDAADMRTDHPNITVVEDPVERWTGPSWPLDAVFALSAIAGLGLDRDDPADDLDHHVVDLFHNWLRPDGLLVMTVPFGDWSVGRSTRTYDEGHLTNLLRDWEIRELRAMERIDDYVWRRVESEDALSQADMALVRATPRS